MTAPRKQGRKNAARKTAEYATFLAAPAAGRNGGLTPAIPRCRRPAYGSADRNGGRNAPCKGTPPACRCSVLYCTAAAGKADAFACPVQSVFGKSDGTESRRSAPRSDRARSCGDAGFYEFPYGRKSANHRVFRCGVLPSAPIKRKEQDYERSKNYSNTRRR